MPELPEVETIARALGPELVGQQITSARLFWKRTLAKPSAAEFERWVLGQSFVEVGRRAKYLHLKLSTYNLFFHLRMSGDLVIKAGSDLPDKHDRLHLGLSDGRVL